MSDKSPSNRPLPQATSDNDLKQYIKYLLIYSIQSVCVSRTKTGLFRRPSTTQHSGNCHIWFGLNIPMNEGMMAYLKDILINVVNQMVENSGTNSHPLNIEVLARCGTDIPVLLERWSFSYQRRSGETFSQSHIFFPLCNLVRCIISSLRVSPAYYRFFRTLPDSENMAFLRVRKDESFSDPLVDEDRTFSQRIIGEVVDFHHCLTVQYTYRNDSYNFSELIDHVKTTCKEQARSKGQKTTVAFKRSESRHYFDNIKFGHLAKFRDEICKGARLVGVPLEIPDFHFYEKHHNAFNVPKKPDEKYIDSHYPSVSNLFVEFYPLSLRESSISTKLTVNSTEHVFLSMAQTMSNLKDFEVGLESSTRDMQFEISD